MKKIIISAFALFAFVTTNLQADVSGFGFGLTITNNTVDGAYVEDVDSDGSTETSTSSSDDITGAAIFAENIGIDQSAIILALILVQFVAFPSTLFWSYIGNKFNDKTVLYSTIFIYICVVIYSTSLSNATEFYIMAALIGSVQGGIQAASRSFFSKIIPTDKSGEFFGFYNTFGRAGSVMGPALVGIFIGIFNNFQIALVPIIILFIAGGFVLRFVKYPNEII